MKRITYILLSIFILTQTTTAQSKADFLSTLSYEYGDYIIKSATELKKLAEYTNAGSDFSGISFKVGVRDMNLGEWVPIGTQENPFRGNFNGNGCTMQQLKISNSDLQYIGLFGYASDGIIKNINLILVQIAGKNSNCYAGGIAGYSNSTIINCSFISSGDTWWDCFNNCYCAGTIVGKSDNKILNCYAKHYWNQAIISGGIVGETSSTVQNCFSDIKDTVTGLIAGNITNTAILKNNYHAEDNKSDNPEIDGVALPSTKFINELNSNIEGYNLYQPLCYWGNSGLISNIDNGLDLFTGKGTIESPYLITTENDLINLATKLKENTNTWTYRSSHYKLLNDIVLTKEFEPIGNNSFNEDQFKGTFDGNGKTISNLSIKTKRNYGGLFGYTNGAVIKNLILKNVLIEAKKNDNNGQGQGTNLIDYAGALIGYATNTTADHNLIYGEITISAKSGVGEICGFMNNNKFTNNYTTNSNKYSTNASSKDGLKLTLLTNNNEETGAGNYLANADNQNISITGVNALIYFLPNIKYSQVKLNETTTQMGWLDANSLEFCTTTSFRRGNVKADELVLNRQPEIWAERSTSGNGWETICLPFDANVYADGVKKTPVTDKNGSYWLREFVSPNENTSGIVSFASHKTMPENGFAIQKNTPYIIAFPGDTYNNNSLKGQTILFKGVGELPSTDQNPQKEVSNNNYIFEGCYQKMTTDSRYMLNSTGTQFESGNFEAAPYQAYFLPKGTSASNVQVLRIATGTNQPTDLTDGIAEEKNIRAYVADGILYLTGDNTQQVKIWNAGSGMMVKEVEVNNETIAVTGLTKGIYIIDREKVVIY